MGSGEERREVSSDELARAAEAELAGESPYGDSRVEVEMETETEVEAETGTAAENYEEIEFEPVKKFLSNTFHGVSRKLDQKELDRALELCKSYLESWESEAEGSYSVVTEYKQNPEGKHIERIRISSSEENDYPDIGWVGETKPTAVGLALFTMNRFGTFGPYIGVSIDPQEGSISSEDYMDLLNYIESWCENIPQEEPALTLDPDRYVR